MSTEVKPEIEAQASTEPSSVAKQSRASKQSQKPVEQPIILPEPAQAELPVAVGTNVTHINAYVQDVADAEQALAIAKGNLDTAKVALKAHPDYVDPKTSK